MIHVLAVITTKPGKRAEVLAAFHANMPAVHAEAGCIEYGPVVDAPNSPAKYGDDTFVVVEKWESPDHLKAHAASPHMAAYGAKTRELLADRQIHIMQNGGPSGEDGAGAPSSPPGNQRSQRERTRWT